MYSVNEHLAPENSSLESLSTKPRRGTGWPVRACRALIALAQRLEISEMCVCIRVPVPNVAGWWLAEPDWLATGGSLRRMRSGVAGWVCA